MISSATPRLGGGRQHRFHIQVGALAVGDQPPAGVADDIHMRVADGVQQALGDLLPRLAQAGVQRSDDDIQLGQHLVREIQRPIGADLHLGALQQADRIAQLACTASISCRWRMELVDRKPAGHAQAAGMVGDRQHFQAASRGPPRPSRGYVSVPSLQVEWECSSARISPISISCGSSPASAACTSPRSSRSSGGIHGSPSVAYTSSSRGAQQLAAIRLEEGLVGERQPAFQRQLAQPHVVIFRAGGVLQGRAKALRRVHPQLGAQVVAELHAGFGLALALPPASRPGGR